MKVDRQLVQLLTTNFSWEKVMSAVLVDPSREDNFSLEAQIRQAKEGWLVALQQLEYADKDMLEACILKVTACEKRYMSLLSAAKREHFHLWDKAELTPLVGDEG